MFPLLKGKQEVTKLAAVTDNTIYREEKRHFHLRCTRHRAKHLSLTDFPTLSLSLFHTPSLTATQLTCFHIGSIIKYGETISAVLSVLMLLLQTHLYDFFIFYLLIMFCRT